VTIPAGTQSGTALRLRGKGMPRLHGRGKGDFYVVVEVRTPTDLTPRQRELLKEFKVRQPRNRQPPGYDLFRSRESARRSRKTLA
jgi:molecular chaperone DnaJ